MRKRFSALFGALALAALAFSQNAAAVSYGSYGSTAVSPTIYSKNIWYNVAFPVVGSPPSAGRVTNVYYRWTYSTPRPSGFQVLLCNNTGTLCADVTSAASGSVNFTGSGVAANTAIRLYSRVSGTGAMTPLYGGSSSVTVNYTY